MKSRIYLNIFFILLSLISYSQNDTVVVLSNDEFLKIVREHHPLVKQSEIKLQIGDANLLYAKGAFDPKISTDIRQKYFDGSQSYSLINSALKIPTWFGLELQGGYENNQGTYLNPENKTTANGLMYAGISLPLGQGLLIDKRRAGLKEAQLSQKMSEMDRRLIINELLYNASNAYWEWFKSYNSLLVYEESYQLAKTRFNAVKSGANLGGRPMVDTLEAGIQVQNRLYGKQQAQLDFLNASAMLSIFLWNEGFIPLELSNNTIPPTIEDVNPKNLSPILETNLDSLIVRHPELNRSRYKIEQLEIEKKWKIEQLKPVINLKYNPITEPVGSDLFANYSINNYKWGLELEMPIFLRKERGMVKLADLKIQEAAALLNNKQVIYQYKFETAKNNYNIANQQFELYTKTVQDSRNLLKAEQKLFRIGESSLFMVNSREVSYIKNELKLVEILTKRKKSEIAIQYSLGELAN